MKARFSAPDQTVLGAHPVSCTMANGSISWAESSLGVALTQFSAEVKEKVKLYLYPSLWDFMTRSRANFFFFTQDGKNFKFTVQISVA